MIGTASLMTVSCEDFLDTTPYDALSPATTWKTEQDAQKFAIGCYDGWESGNTLLYMDCMSDFGYNNFPWEGFKDQANGNMETSNTGAGFYDYSIIRRCNSFLENIEKVPFANEADKKDLIAQVRTIRAYKYFVMNWMYGGVPIIDNYQSAEEAQVPRKTEAEVRKFIADELDAAIPDLKDAPAERGRIAKGAALALKMREALYYGDWAVAKEKAQQIMDLGQYSLEPDYLKLFQVAGQDSKEIILAVQYIPQTKALGTIGQMYNNADGGWSSIVPTHNLVDTYEMKNGKTIDEADSGYDPVHPFKGRDPRLAMTIIYPGADYVKTDGSVAIFNTLDKQINGEDNANYMTIANNASKTGLTWNKYLSPITQYANIWETEACPIVFRYAEVLLTWAEAENELAGPSESVYDKLNQIRQRVGMPKVDKAKYATKDALRKLIQRERGVELAGEGVRRADIFRWDIAKDVLEGTLECRKGTVSMDSSVDPEMRATIDLNASPSDVKIEERHYQKHHRYLPLGQGLYDKNPKLVQNPGYAPFAVK